MGGADDQLLEVFQLRLELVVLLLRLFDLAHVGRLLQFLENSTNEEKNDRM
jgi:hypothetical protein